MKQGHDPIYKKDQGSMLTCLSSYIKLQRIHMNRIMPLFVICILVFTCKYAFTKDDESKAAPTRPSKSERIIESVTLDKAYAEKPDAYAESRRPQFHFSPQTGWMNDPNGLVYYKGVYHLYYQAWPKAVGARGKIWSHAVSKDLIHWKQIDHALLNEGHRQIFSGSAVIDHNNTAGFTKRKRKIVDRALYTDQTACSMHCLVRRLRKDFYKVQRAGGWDSG